MSMVKTARLSDFCITGSGGTPSRNNLERYYEGGTIPWIKSGELRESVINQAEEHVTDAALKESSIKLVPAGAILLAMYGATVGRLGILGIEATTNQAVCHIVPDPKVADTQYIYHALSSQVPNLISMGVGGAQPNINQGIIKGLEIPLPPLPEQRRIAAILDQANALRAKRREALVQLDSLTQSIFTDMFGDPIQNPKGWKTCSLGDLLSTIRNGINAEQSDDENGWPISRIETIWNGSVDPTRIRYIDPDEAALTDFKLDIGDILFSHINSPEHIAKTAIYEGVPSILIHGVNLLRLRGDDSIVEPKWLLYLLKHAATRTYFRTRCKKAVNQASLNQQDIKAFKCIFPPKREQEIFSDRIKCLEKLKVIYSLSLSELNTLFSSIQHRAFRGEL